MYLLLLYCIFTTLFAGTTSLLASQNNDHQINTKYTRLMTYFDDAIKEYKLHSQKASHIPKDNSNAEESINDLLYNACKNNDLPKAQTLLKNGAQPNVINPQDKQTPLYVAVQHDNPELILLLLNHGADVNQHCGAYNETPLHNAINYNNTNIVCLLLQHKANPNIQNNTGNTPLHGIRGKISDEKHIEIITIMLDHGAKLDIKNQHNETLWDIASKKLYHGLYEHDAGKQWALNVINHGASIKNQKAPLVGKDFIEIFYIFGGKIIAEDDPCTIFEKTGYFINEEILLNDLYLIAIHNRKRLNGYSSGLFKNYLEQQIKTYNSQNKTLQTSFLASHLLNNIIETSIPQDLIREFNESLIKMLCNTIFHVKRFIILNHTLLSKILQDYKSDFSPHDWKQLFLHAITANEQSAFHALVKAMGKKCDQSFKKRVLQDVSKHKLRLYTLFFSLNDCIIKEKIIDFNLKHYRDTLIQFKS